MYKLTDEGKQYLESGLPEKMLLKILPKKISQLKEFTIAIGWAKKNEWIEIKDGVVKATVKGKESLNKKSDIKRALDEINKKGDSKLSNILLKRKLVEETKEIVKEKEGLLKKIFKKKQQVPIEELKEIAQLTPEMIKTGKWKNIPFRNYDVHSPVPKIYAAKKQPYVQFIEDFKDRLVGLGYKEISGPLVETSFWNCDALFMPADHPARGIHDVLIVKNPDNERKICPEDCRQAIFRNGLIF